MRFLGAGDKVKITIMFRGREQHRPELGFRLLQKLAEDVQELGFVESSPKQDGRNMIMVLGPHKKKADAKIDADAARATRAQARADAKAEEDAEREAAHARRPRRPEEGASAAPRTSIPRSRPERSEGLDRSGSRRSRDIKHLDRRHHHPEPHAQGS